MENFIVSARKYRPATFDSVVGQAPITTTLKNAIKNKHLAQAFLFCGPRGVGKTTCARILAKTINCENVSESTEACDKCESCTSFNQSHSFNIHELDAASNNGVDDIRNLIEQVRIAPQVGKYSIYIIDEVHMLSIPAFNAFLKTLEEPPAHAIFILATTSKQKIIPTILSRCQIFDFSRIQVSDIAKHLEFIARSEEVTAESDALHIIAQKADGSLRDALSMFDQLVSFAGIGEITYDMVIENLNILDYDYYFKITRFINERDISKCLLEFNEILNKGFDGHNFITGLGEHFRNLLVCKDASTLELLQVGSNIKDKYKEQSTECSQEFLLTALNIINKFDIQYKASINARLHVELALMRLCSMDSYFYFTQKPTPGLSQREGRANLPTGLPDRQAHKNPGHDSSPAQSTGKSISADDSTKAQPTDTSFIKEEGTTQLSSGPTLPTDRQATSTPETKQSVSEPDTKLMSQKAEISPKESSGETLGSETSKPQTPSPEPRQEHHGQLKPQTISIYQAARLPVKQVGEQAAENPAKTDPSLAPGETTSPPLQPQTSPERIGDSAHGFSEEARVEVSSEQLEKIWAEYTSKLKEKGKYSLYSTLTKRKPILSASEDKNGNVIEIIIDNTVQEDEINAEKTELLGFLRRELNVPDISITIILNKNEEDRKPYTSQEKFKRMAEKNPAIQKLKQQLDLDIDI